MKHTLLCSILSVWLLGTTVSAQISDFPSYNYEPSAQQIRNIGTDTLPHQRNSLSLNLILAISRGATGISYERLISRRLAGEVSLGFTTRDAVYESFNRTGGFLSDGTDALSGPYHAQGGYFGTVSLIVFLSPGHDLSLTGWYVAPVWRGFVYNVKNSGAYTRIKDKPGPYDASYTMQDRLLIFGVRKKFARTGPFYYDISLCGGHRYVFQRDIDDVSSSSWELFGHSQGGSGTAGHPTEGRFISSGTNLILIVFGVKLGVQF